MVCQVLKPGSTIKSVPTLSQLHATHRFDNSAFGAIIHTFDENIKGDKIKQRALNSR